MPQPTIIAVDDETDDIFFLRHLLQKTSVPHRFQPFANGQAAIAGLTALIAASPAESLPLVSFVDIKMAAMTGLDLLRWIRSQRPLDVLPVIMYSSSHDPGDIDAARELGAQGYLKKYPSVVAMQTVLEEAKEFSLVPAAKKSFLQWNYRFVGAADSMTVE